MCSSGCQPADRPGTTVRSLVISAKICVPLSLFLSSVTRVRITVYRGDDVRVVDGEIPNEVIRIFCGFPIPDSYGVVGWGIVEKQYSKDVLLVFLIDRGGDNNASAEAVPRHRHFARFSLH